MLGIRIAMWEKGVTNAALAKGLNLHRNSIYKKVYGKAPFLLREALTIQKAFFPEYPVEYLFTEAEEKTASQGTP